MRVRVHVNSTVHPGPKVDHPDIVGIRRTSARTCALHFYIKLLKMVSNTRCDIIFNGIPESLAKNAVRDARALLFKSF